MEKKKRRFCVALCACEGKCRVEGDDGAFWVENEEMGQFIN